ncbi:hypothetical protein DFH09DRAFT_558913 [Mycena vulgaris]|nr:hypothetical protein DFH09DRAFT_558913 [Mycena vulgaris]
MLRARRRPLSPARAQTARELVGARYDECHTMAFPGTLSRQTPSRLWGRTCNNPSIVDLLVLAELATTHDRTRAGYPPTLFLALKTLFNGVVTSNAKRRVMIMPLPKYLAEDANSAVVEAFPTRRKHMQEQIARRHRGPSTAYYHNLQAQISDTSRDLEVALAKVALLEENIIRLTVTAVNE